MTALVSCIMPTADRRAYVPHAIEYFLRQDYPDRELVILDDGNDAIGDLIPDDPRIRYLREGRRRSIGAKRNACVEAARGDIVLHWDDDDWFAADRVTRQVAGLEAANADLCGCEALMFFDPAAPAAWLYRYPGRDAAWVSGVSMCYRRDLWRRNPFADMQVGEDSRFIWSAKGIRVARLGDCGLIAALIHPGNTSPRRTRASCWAARPIVEVQALLGADWARYGRPPVEAPRLPPSRMVPPPAIASPAPQPARTTDADPALPVWTYWEGPMPDWIGACLKTARRNAPNFRLLGPADFDKLWDRDRDLDISRLHVAHRADFIRAFLLARFGGLWIDADCVVTRDLAPLLAQVGQFDMVTNRERQGLFSNAFLGARPGSALAARFYDIVRTRLRDPRPLSWIEIGNRPLTALLEAATEPVLELPTETVQPICWSRPETLFRLADDDRHACAFDAAAWCYMLSNQHVTRHRPPSTGVALTDPRTFFSYLLRRAHGAAPQSAGPNPSPRGLAAGGPAAKAFERLRETHRAEGQDSLSGPGSSLAQTAEIRRRLPLLLQKLGVRVMLDAPCGDFHWMSRVRLGVEDYIGIDLLEDVVAANRAAHGAPGRRFMALDLLDDGLPRADLVLCRDCLGHLSYAEIRRALRNLAASGSRYVLTTTFPDRGSNMDIRRGEWRPLNLQKAPFSFPAPLELINEGCTERSGAFRDKSLGLWRLHDLPNV